MSISLTVNGQTYEYPETGDNDWGPEATDWAEAVTIGMLQKAGGLFQLLSEVDFGTSYGIKSLYYKTRSANIATIGQIRMANDDVIAWRNNANDADLSLTVDSDDALNFNGTAITIGGDPVQTEITVSDTSTIDLTLAASNLSADIVAGSITNAMVSASAAIAYSKLDLSASIVNADISASAAIAYSKLSLTGSIVNADISASAAIANSKLAQMATLTIKGNNTGGSATPLDLTATQVTAMLNNVVGDSGSGGTKGLVPAPAAGDAALNKFLKADGTWTAPPGSGDVTGPASSTDSGFARFDGLTGKLLKNSPATIVNADVDASAAIAYSKLNLSGSIVNADISASAAIAYSKLSLTGSIVNADISASAAIDFSKLAALTSANILVGNGSNVATSVAMTGDIAITNAGVTSYSGTVPVNKGGTGQTSYTNGQLLIGNTTGNTLTKATLTAGSGISITNGTGSITIARTLTAPTIQKFTSGSGTYTTAANVLYIRVVMVGGGGGGAGNSDGSYNGGDGGTGGTTTFGTTLLSAGGGSGGTHATSAGAPGSGGTGGTASLGTGPVGIALNGGRGGSGSNNGASVSSTIISTGFGAASAFGGSGGNATGSAGITNTGGGGAGANGNNATNGHCGAGGGAGAYVDAIITSPSASYSYAVGAAGTAGTAGTNGNAGGAGGSGIIVVYEYYQ